jgi:hypothetical protein
MTKSQLAAAFDLAKTSVDLSAESIDVFLGYALPAFDTVYVTIGQVARLIRWECGTFAGTWDMEAFQTLAHVGRARFQVLE